METVTEDKAAEEARIVAEVEAELMNGTTFAKHAASARSVYGYVPPAHHNDYGAWLKTLGNLAEWSASMVQPVQQAIGRLNPYVTVFEQYAAVAESFAHSVEAGWDDVLARTGPEPIRHSEAQKKFTLSEIGVMYAALKTMNPSGGSSGLGWAFARVFEGRVDFAAAVRLVTR